MQKKIAIISVMLISTFVGCVDGNSQPTESLDKSKMHSAVDSNDLFWVDPDTVGKPYGEVVNGLITFRGNQTRTYYGTGPLPSKAPKVNWTFPKHGRMCGISYVGTQADTWCGLGWTGQPAVFEWNKKTVIVFGAYDYQVHFLDANTGEPILKPLKTKDIIKGSPTIDPDGYPLIYIGSRDNNLRIISFDDGELKELWSLNAYDVEPVLWNDDWDSAPLILRDFLLTGGENGHFHAVKLNRQYDEKGKVSVNPELISSVPGWDKQLLRDFPKQDVQIEGSVAIYKNTVYFANSAGLVQGWDLNPVISGGKPKRTFRFWAGEDIDASIVVDKNGYIYVATEYEIGTKRAQQVGQILKLDPRINKGNPLVWSHHVRSKKPDGVWASPALTDTHLIVNTDSGDILGINTQSGNLDWKIKHGNVALWSSPAVIENRLLVATCRGTLYTYELQGDKEPQELWSKQVSEGCFEATPAIWKGTIYIGNRDGKLYSLTEEKSQ